VTPQGTAANMCIFCVLPLMMGGLLASVVPTERERSRHEIYFNKPILVLLGFSMFWTLSMFIAPLTIPPHTVENITDGTSALDFTDKWANMNFFAKVIYTIGDSQCHQLGARTYYINDNEMPMCARCMALYLWANLGIVTAMLVQPRYDISKAAVYIFPAKVRRYLQSRNLEFKVWVLLCIVCILTTAIDGFYQLLTPYESTNLNRLVFSIPTGWFGGFVIGLMINTVYYGTYKEEILYQPPPSEIEAKKEGPPKDVKNAGGAKKKPKGS